ncbi:hypothetical protein LZZ85_03915 [Terrimonas sp. NA20]|uniref:Uncharacterized protein n=1 Tax=Terrimonas ginsenosidimutans TaxID=2908004 RepID=A0ABS9KM51_9BACT|nr:hypothetical protein [Terrimonas ginsenosidimutans]MCG2613408.1 hypothetical protein [Terrimonas ginsenosidimutans]
MSMPSIPTSFTHKLRPETTFDVDTTLDGGLDTNLSGSFGAIHSGSLETKVSGELKTDNVLKLTGDANQPVATDSKVEILNLPRFTLQDIKDMMKVRMRIPNYSNVCVKLFGVEMLSVCVSGEGQVITEPYIPNAAERCETTDCCEPDTRPFPDRGNVTGNTAGQNTGNNG